MGAGGCPEVPAVGALGRQAVLLALESLPGEAE